MLFFLDLFDFFLFFSTDATEALCRTSTANRTMKGHLRMNFDKGVRHYTGGVFEYVEDPVIESAESGVTGQLKVPKGIPAGGIKISVIGKNLAYIQNPQMYVYYEEKMFISVSNLNTKLTLKFKFLDISLLISYKVVKFINRIAKDEHVCLFNN